MTTRITGHAAITVADMLSIPLYSYADPTDGARAALPRGEALAICREDPSLVYVDSDEVADSIDDDSIRALQREAHTAGDGVMSLACSRALVYPLDGRDDRVACARAIADAVRS